MIFQFFSRYMFSQRSGALIKVIARLSIVGIGVGMMALVVVMSVMSGFNLSIREKLLVAKPHVIVEGESEKLSEWLAKLQTKSGIQAHIVSQQDVIIKTVDGDFGGAIAKGIDNVELTKFFNRIETSTQRPSEVEVSRSLNFDLGENEVVLGMGLARSLDVYEGDQLIVIPPEALLMPADMVPIYEKVVVSSIIETELQDVDTQFMYFNRAEGLKKLRRSKSLSAQIEVRLDDPYNFQAVSSAIADQSANISTWQDRDKALFYALKMERIIMGGFISIATLITCFSIITVLTLLMTQKKKEIGVLMALGMPHRRVKRLYVGLGLLLSMFGLVGGIILGLAVCLFISGVELNILPDIYYDRTIPVQIEPQFVLIAFIVGAIIAFVGSVLPVLYNLRYNSSDALSDRA